MNNTKKIKIFLGLLSNRGFKFETVVSLLNMVQECREFDWVIKKCINGYTIAENRNWVAAQAVKEDAQYVLFIDDDMQFPSDIARLLVKRDKDILGVPYHMKIFPRQIYLLREDDSVPLSKTEPNEALAIGTGIALIKTEVFKKVPQPWFDFKKHENGMVAMGEDYFFCDKAYGFGYKCFVEPEETFKDKDGKDTLGHVGDWIF